MTIDISRKTFRPQRNIAWTTAMQGRVVTDAPQNEDRGIRDRRFRAGTVDLIGRGGYPVALPTSFEITVSAGELMIGPGRYYVDGHLAENFGIGTPFFDDVLSELRGPDPVPFDQQPFLPGVQPAPPLDGQHLVYLDVWQRDLTFLEDVSILDPAVPVDTFARRQTVWQVKTFGPVDQSVTCATPDGDVANWPALIAPSAARLTTRANPASAVADPCELPPGAAYRGIDNRTYTYVIHDFAADGTPLVKFSRSHGVIATTILSLPQADILEVTEVAKDDFLRFNPGDWVEITDEARLLSDIPGVMARVLGVDDPSNTITLENPLPAGTVRLDGAGPDLDQAFHPVIRRWDQFGVIRDTAGTVIVDLDQPGSTGLIPVLPDGTFIALEDGVEAALSLDPAGGAARIGDSWTFIARYADSSVQELNAAPPEDFQHHYARIALVDSVGGVFLDPVVSDCRDPIDPGECCCTVIVFPGDDIQAAIDSLPPDFGGCICLKSGLHEVRSTLVISTPNITFHGESKGAILRMAGPGPVLQIVGAAGIRVESLRFEHLEGNASSGIIELLEATDAVIRDCTFVAKTFEVIGVLIVAYENITVSECEFGAMSIGVATVKRVAHIRVADNRMRLGSGDLPAQLGVWVADAVGPVQVLGNRITGAVTGVGIDDDPSGLARHSLAAGSLVADNDIELAGPPGGPGDDVVLFGIDTASDDTQIRDNHIAFAGSARAGIRATGHGLKITGNTVNVELVDDARNLGIFVGNDDGQATLTAEVAIVGNTLRGMTSGIVSRDVTDLIIEANQIGALIAQSFQPGILLSETVDALVSGNTVKSAGSGLISSQGRNLRANSNTIEDAGFGIGIFQEMAPTLAGNAMRNVALFGAIGLACLARTAFIENRVVNAGWGGGLPIGLGALFVLGEWFVESNEVMNTGMDVNNKPNPAAALGIAGFLILESQVECNLVTYSSPDLLPDGREDRALVLQGLLEISFGDREPAFGFPCQITDNKFVGKGNSALVELRQTPLSDSINLRFERVFFNQNYCNHFGASAEVSGNATVQLVGSAGVVMGNQIKTASDNIGSVNMNGMPGTVVGNITRRGFIDHPNFPAPLNNFNRVL